MNWKIQENFFHSSHLFLVQTNYVSITILSLRLWKWNSKKGEQGWKLIFLGTFESYGCWKGLLYENLIYLPSLRFFWKIEKEIFSKETRIFELQSVCCLKLSSLIWNCFTFRISLIKSSFNQDGSDH